ncbi:DMT family transporter [Paracoccus sp. TK19116]|uniref:DMT family transporter n=1 Tax=Paracoccus albicereus TaxID=2922394 RepID=A0ABT1MNH4_9RHOB|nr:DMT family transporter [Paracoccus albicereus]MCQ0969822.1 DMT family transporter [Paracoccus albicereus]
MNTFRAALLMVLSMGFFALEDMVLKLLGGRMPVGQVLMMAGTLGLALYWALMAARGRPLWSRDLLHPAVMLRNLGEGLAAITFVTALVTGDLSSASAILQALPLTITLGAALFLAEPVGWRRWLSILAGFAGVLLIVRPGAAAFQPASLLAVVAVLALTLRDLATRRIPDRVSSDALTASAFGAVVPAGLILFLIQRQPAVMPQPADLAWLLAGSLVGLSAYLAMVVSMRFAPIATIAPFRYSRLVFAMLVGIVVFSERPDAITWLGAAVIVGSGIYAMWRETRLSRAGRATQTPASHRGSAGPGGAGPR